VTTLGEATQPAETARRFRATLRAKRAELAAEAATNPKAIKLLVRVDTVLALTDELYRDLLH
jgi:hypothetical protein